MWIKLSKRWLNLANVASMTPDTMKRSEPVYDDGRVIGHSDVYGPSLRVRFSDGEGFEIADPADVAKLTTALDSLSASDSVATEMLQALRRASYQLATGDGDRLSLRDQIDKAIAKATGATP